MEKCGICGREFATGVALAQHTKDKHANEEPAAGRSSERPATAKGKGRSLRKRNRHPVVIAVVVVAVVLGVGLYALVSPQVGGFPFPCLGQEGEQIHVHPYLRIMIDGQNVTVPVAVGMRGPTYQNSNGIQVAVGGTCFEPMHTHDSSGIIHIESPTMTNYTLGDFFAIWKDTYSTVAFNGTSHPVTFSSTDILGYKADANHALTLIVDGHPSAAYGALLLDSLDYCASGFNTAPCSPTATNSTPLWFGGASQYPYGTGHTIVIEYTTK